ncbi:murein biosynthesis integral membrane protein MurJ [Parasulfuritortus cantonensis]|uniref:Probable lipid II flippase MurJ n=1 Tax=Parasulfuritortus cantonensis TaxID=2528202 RepID=A0A4R1BEC6_9PROT|nr:murein biosynthesis integral membrane protein MurJ [Parasulfuritortus cantonensis]TCJ15368.1 murein biosynthesis integral membrane protein MurJ [Parasulfuritortus cantonensis]
MNLLKALAAVSSMTLLSRILGFVRDAVIARSFGAGAATDAFFVAFKLPNLLRRLFAEGAFSQAFVPVLAEYKNRRGEAATHVLVNRVATLLFVILMAVAALGVIGAPLIVLVSAPGFTATPDKFELTVTLTRIVFPYIVFISLVSLAGGVLNTWSRFQIPAFTPVLLNVAMILAAALAAPWFDPPVLALGWGAFLGGILQLSIQVPALRRLGMVPGWDWAPRDEGVRRILKLMGPAALGVSVAQISLIINTLFASFLDTGSVSWLYYADRLMEFPTGMLGVALGTILLPSLAKHHADNDAGEYSKLLDWGLRMTLLLAAPAAIALGILAVPLVATLFYHGEFSGHDVEMTRQALVAYSVGLLGLILVKVLAPGFYARQNIKTPVKIAVFTLLATQTMNLAFVWQLRHAGLALAIGLGACLNAGILYHHLRKQDIFRPQPGWPAFLARLAVALAVMAATLWFGMLDEARWLAYPTVTRIGHLALLVLAGATSYFVALGLLGFRPSQFRRRA